METSNKSASQAWMAYHPYTKATSTDHYYIGICIRIRDILKGKLFKILFDSFDHIALTELAAFLVSYFEDVISDLGLWRAFRDEHEQLYGKRLPFYDLTDDYFEEEINFADVAFLIWYYLTCKQDSESGEQNGCILNPDAPEILVMTGKVFAIFEEQYEYAVENTALMDPLILPGTVVTIGFVKWMGEWWFSGMMLVWGKEKDFSKADKSLISASLFSDENDEWKKTINDQYDLFLKFNHGRPVAFFDSFFEANNFIRDFMFQWNFEMRKKLNQPGDEKIPPFLPQEIPPAIRERYNDDCLVFFNKEAGIEFLTHMCPVIPDENNKLYKGSTDPALPMHLVMANDCSCGFVNFALDQYGFRKYLLFPGEKNARLVPDNLDFLIRLYKRNGYFPEPQVHMVDSKRFR